MNPTTNPSPTPTPAAPGAMRSGVVWQGEMALSAELEGFTLTLDADPEFGGRGLGPRPKGLVLTALCGCTAMDVVAILDKMRVVVDAFAVTADATLTTTHPKVFARITLRYDFTGHDLPTDKLRRAVQLSQDRYCGVSAMLRPTAELERVIVVNGVELCRHLDPSAPPSPS